MNCKSWNLYFVATPACYKRDVKVCSMRSMAEVSWHRPELISITAPHGEYTLLQFLQLSMLVQGGLPSDLIFFRLPKSFAGTHLYSWIKESNVIGPLQNWTEFECSSELKLLQMLS